MTNMKTEQIIDTLINKISAIPEVRSIGISGGKKPFPYAGEGDIDIFIYCDSLPTLNMRQAVLHETDGLQETKVNEFEGGHWGAGDFALTEGVETWLMYFTMQETSSEIDANLRGDFPDKLNNYYYPTGRCAMLRDMWIRYDENGFLGDLQKRLSEYPESLAKTLTEHHTRELDDVEDLERAVKRKDVLFYHFALDIAIDHYLQALFAINRTFFPSRKRSLQYIDGFHAKPHECAESLLKVVRLGSEAETIHESYALWRKMTQDLKKIV